MKRLGKALAAILVGAGFLCFLGCGGINTITSEGSSTYTKIGDVFLDNQISVDDIQVDKSSSPKVYSVKIRDLMHFDMVLEVKMDFYDQTGVKLDNPWGWKPVTVEEKQDEWIKFTAPSDLAINFKLYVKKAE